MNKTSLRQMWEHMFVNNEQPVTHVELRHVSVDCLTLELETVTEKDREHYDEEDEHEDDEDKDEESTALLYKVLSNRRYVYTLFCVQFICAIVIGCSISSDKI